MVPTEPATVAAQVADNEGPDVWIPDSSRWVPARLERGATSLASSPLVLAVPRSAATALQSDGGRLSVDQLLPSSANAAGPVRWVLADPRKDTTSAGALLALKQAVARRAQKNGLLTTIVRASSDVETSLTDLSTGNERLALPVSEQQLFDVTSSQPEPTLAAAYPDADGFSFDYPYVVLTSDQRSRARAADLLESLQGDLGRGMLDASGFRATDGTAGPDLAAAAQLSRPTAHAGSVPKRALVDAAVETYVDIVRPSRLLALIDISGSMRKVVPGAHGATRLDLALQASVNGLAVYPDATSVGLWVFATDLTPKTDYQVVAPLAPLGRGPDGISGRVRMAYGLSQVGIASKGKSGLYDTTLAAVREVRKGWDPDSANSVVIISDGGNNDPNGITLRTLLRTLRAESDAQHPVTVFGIAYGPSANLEVLADISEVTGGRAYAAPDPRQISSVLRDAIGRRACSDDC